MPGESYTYRFVTEDAGTYWYHSHQQVLNGLYGAFIVEPTEEADVDPASADRREDVVDLTLLFHLWETDELVQVFFRDLLLPFFLRQASKQSFAWLYDCRVDWERAVTN